VASGIHLWLVLMNAYRALVRHAERSIVELDVCLSDFAILELLLHKGPQKVTELGRRVDLTSGAMTTAIDRLEARRLVVREPHPADRRAWVVLLTSAGRAVIEPMFAAHEAAMSRATSSLGAAERARLTNLLKKLGLDAERQLTPERSELRQRRSS